MDLKIHKKIPRSNVPLEQRKKMKQDRIERYPEIEILDPSQTGSLSAGPDDPVNEEFWGDPVNLIYPLARKNDTEPDRDRSNNARLQFIKFANSQYTNDKSKAFVYERILRAQIKAGTVNPSFDSESQFDNLLPEDLKTELIHRQEKSLENKMSVFDKAIQKFDKIVGKEKMVKKNAHQILDDVVKTIQASTFYRRDPKLEDAISLIEMAKGLVHDGTGDPESLGMNVDDHSKDENWSPVKPSVVRNMEETRSFMNPLSTETLSNMVEGQSENNENPQIGETPGPSENKPLPPTNLDLTMPPATRPSAMDIAGVTKNDDSMYTFLAKSLG